MNRSTAMWQLPLKSVALGWVVGVFVQLSTLRANYHIISVWDDDESARISQQVLLAGSFLWSLAISAVGFVLAAILCCLFSTVYNQMEGLNNVSRECRIVIGTLIGVCVAWLATDVVIGVPAQIAYSTAVLLMAIGWCRFIVIVSAAAPERQPSQPTQPAAKTLDAEPSSAV